MLGPWVTPQDNGWAVNQADYQSLQRFRTLQGRHTRLSVLAQAWTLRNHFAHTIQRIRGPFASDKTLRLARLAYLTGEIDEKGWETRV